MATESQQSSSDATAAAPLSASLVQSSPNQGQIQANQDKVDRILSACLIRDIDTLIILATSKGGLINDNARRKAWPILLGCNHLDERENLPSWQSLKPHRDEEQVALDVNRSFVYYPNEESDQKIAERKVHLSNLITEVLRRNPYLCYFQGYHDIVQVFLLVLGASSEAVPVVERLSVLHIRDFMLPTMTGALSHLSLLPAILAAADIELYTHLSRSAPFYFALSATLTLYAHDIQEYGDIARLFDFLLANETVISIYLFTTIICSRKKQLLELEADEHDMLHSILSKLPKPLDLEALIAQTAELYEKYPPEKLTGFSWFRVSSYSVLKTARSPLQVSKQTLKDGERAFHKHAEEIRRHDMRKRQMLQARRLMTRYRRPILTTTATLLVTAIAIYIRRSDYSLSQLFGEGPARLLIPWGGALQ